MDADHFARLALQLPGAVQGAHSGHADFRVRRGVFATLGYPDPDHGMVKLTPEQSEIVCASDPHVFSPAKGAWGRGGATLVRLAALTEDTATSVLKMAWVNRTGEDPRV